MLIASAHSWLDRLTNCLRHGVIAYVLLFSIAALAPMLFLRTVPFAPDPAAFLDQVNDVILALQGVISWDDAARHGYLRSFAFQIPIGYAAYITEVFSPDFYLVIYWLIYIVPVPFFIWRLARNCGAKPDWYTALLPLIFFADPLMPQYAAGGFFTDPPMITLSFMSFVLAHEVLVLSNARWRIFKSIVGALFLALAVCTRFQSAIPFILPFYMAFLLYAVWPLDAKKLRNLFLLICVYALIGLAVVAFVRAWIPFLATLELARDYDNTIWKYGVGGIEAHRENATLFRLGFNTGTILSGMTGLFLISLLHTSWAHPRERALSFLFIGAVTCLILFLSLAHPAHPRYVMVFIFIALVYIGMTQITSARLKLAAGVIIAVLAADGIYSLLPEGIHHRSPVFSLRAMLGKPFDYGASINASVYERAQLNKETPFRDIVNEISLYREDKALNKTKLAVLNSAQSLIKPGSLLFFIQPLRLMHKEYADLNKNLVYTTIYTGEMITDEIYRSLLAQNIAGLITAHLLLTPASTAAIPEKKSWIEDIIIEDVAAAPDTSLLGLKLLNSFSVHDHLKGEAAQEDYALYQIKDRKRWMDFIRKITCAQNDAAINAIAYLCKAPAKIGPLDAQVDQDSLLKSISIYRQEDKFYLGVRLVTSDLLSLDRIFLHFIKSPSCPFMAHDFTIATVNGDQALVEIPREKLAALQRCHYMARAGTNHDFSKDPFSKKDFLGGIEKTRL